MKLINLILRRKQVLVMSSPEWKQWIADMHKAFPDDVANKAIEITAKHQHFGWAE